MQHHSALIDYAAPIVGCRVKAGDIVQEAYALFSTGQVDGCKNASPVSCLYRIVRNLSIDWLRNPPSRHEAMEPDRPWRYADGHSDEPLMYRGPGAFSNALEELPGLTRYAFTMHRIDGKTLHEIAEVLEVPHVRVHQLVREALAHGTWRMLRGEDSPKFSAAADWLLRLEARPHDRAYKAMFDAWLAVDEENVSAYRAVAYAWDVSRDPASK